MERRSSPRNKYFGPKPVDEGSVYTVEIEGIGAKGDGVGRVKGFVVIVPGVSKGDKVDVKITAVRGKVAFGEKVSGDAAKAGKKPKGETEEESEVEESKENEETEGSETAEDENLEGEEEPEEEDEGLEEDSEEEIEEK